MLHRKEYLMRLADESLLVRHPVAFELDDQIKSSRIKELEKLKKEMDEEEYQLWKVKYLENEFKRTEDESWVTVCYRIPGMGDYYDTVPDVRKHLIYDYVKTFDEGLVISVKPATKNEILNALGMLADRDI